jgi:hypothetical protein
VCCVDFHHIDLHCSTGLDTEQTLYGAKLAHRFTDYVALHNRIMMRLRCVDDYSTRITEASSVDISGNLKAPRSGCTVL